MRNVFDQYDQPENKLTHALVTALGQDRALLRPFLRWLGLQGGSPQTELGDVEAQGLPDACVFDADGWAVMFESKVQARVQRGQIQRHRKRAMRHGFDSPHVVVIAVDEPSGALPVDTISITWRDVYCWFSKKSSDSFWARELVRYMEVFERKMLGQGYDIRGSITVFDGLRFDADNPYTYREGKRLIRLLGDELRSRQDLHRIGVDPKGAGRSAITGKGMDRVWDFLPLRVARSADQFTFFPHLTMVLRQACAIAAVTVPNDVKGGFRKKLGECGLDGFWELVTGLEEHLRPVIEPSQRAKAMIYVTQRHYRSQRSQPDVYARLEADLRTAVPGVQDGVRYQPEWLHAIYELLVQKRSNMQFGVEVQFHYDCPIVQSAKAVDLFAESWKAMRPLISFVLSGNSST